MSVRSSITNALVEKFKAINGDTGYLSNVYNNVYALNKFWDEVSDWPCIYVVPGAETREYLPAGFKWGYLHMSIKAYVKEEVPVQALENLLQDIEKVIDANNLLAYDTNKETTEISITSIVTDEGLLIPYGVGEVSLVIRYQVL